MSLGIKSLWRARSRCCDVSGLPLISRDPLPSRVPRPSSGCLNRRNKSTATSNPISSLETETDSPQVSELPGLPTRGQFPRSLGASEDESLAERETHPESRNRLFKDAFRIEAREMEGQAARKLHKPFITTIREYPNAHATRTSEREHMLDVRRQIGHSIIWKHFNTKMPEWTECFHLIKRMTPKWSDRTSMSAVRIVLPKSWDIDVNNQNLEYVDSGTGVLRKLRTAVDKNPSAIVLRGKSSVLASAADEIVKFCKEAEVYELGEVETSDYKTKQLWPTIEGAPNGGASLPQDETDNIWVHKEYQPHVLTTKYEDVPRPEIWTRENFEAYIATLTYGQIPAHLVISLYGNHSQYGRFVDTEGIRISLIMEAFEDRAARPFITASVLKMAMSLMAFKGGHRAKASQLIKLGEEWGIPMDTDIFNIMLEGYAHKQDVGFFFKFLRRMQARYYRPNIRTWLLFLQLIKGEDERRQAIVAMYELGMFNHNATRKGIAEVMASHDAYTAFKTGKSLNMFLQDQKERYGENWSSVGAANGIVDELLRFDRVESPRIEECKRYIDRQIAAGREYDLSTFNAVIFHAAAQKNWADGLWALSRLKQLKCEPDQETYRALMLLCIRCRSPHALGTLYFYGVLDRKLAKVSRAMLRKVLLLRHPDPFWQKHQPGIFPRDVLEGLHTNQIPHFRSVMSRIERVILEKWDGYTPTKHLAHALELAFKNNDQPLHSQLRARVKNTKIRPLALKLKRVDGEPGQINVRLVGTFRPEKMVKNWARVKDEGEAEGGDSVKATLSPEEDGLLKDDWEDMGMSPDDFTESVDLETVQAIQAKLSSSESPPFQDVVSEQGKAQSEITTAKDTSAKALDDALIRAMQSKRVEPKQVPS